MQPHNKPPNLKDILCWSLFLAPLTATALQQQPQHAYTSRAAVDRLSDAAASSQDRWRASASDSLDTPVSNQRFKDTHAENRSRERRRTSENERALATYAPAGGSLPAVRQPPASRSSATAGLTSRQPARSLQDWRVEDIVLLATVDGKLHARDRTTGAARWQLEVDTPMVETTYHRHNRSLDEHGLEIDDPIWIVEPSQDGSIYVYVPGSGLGMQRLGYTVKELADLAPYAGEGHPAVAYTAEKKNTLYTIDAGTGNILKVFSSAGAITNDDRSCRKVNPLESLDEDDEECEPIGTLLLGRTEYTIGVQTLAGEPISTIRYFEWGPNNRDQDLKSKYTSTMDRKYVYSRYDGSVLGLDLGTRDDYNPVPANKPVYREKFSSPVARVFDIVRPTEDFTKDAALVVLPQPVGPALDELSTLDDDTFDNVFVNCTESGSWYALSEVNYPYVTEGAQTAQAYSDDHFGVPVLPMSKSYRDRFMGVHQLSPMSHRTGTPMVGAPEYPGIEAPPRETHLDSVELLPPKGSRWQDQLPSVRILLLTIVVASLAACGTLYRDKLRLVGSKAPIIQETVTSIVEVPTAVAERDGPQTPTMLREGEPAKETIFPTPEPVPEDSPQADFGLDRAESREPADEDEDDPKETKEAKGKHKRGKRGGKKQKEKEQLAAEKHGGKRKLSQVPQPAEVISVVASESPDVAGPLQINSLVIHKDKLIGQGSSGTLVFEGSFEGRDVAVKRMLSQHYELALQEVSFLQQSDDHANVVRYFCQQKDDHFLYIAVELCQASLYDVWDADRAKTEDRQRQLQTLKLAIQQDTPRALQQLAAGLAHLHNLRIIHRDIKPQNILVAYPKRGQSAGPRLVISDFGLGKNLPENMSTINDATVNAGTTGWKAPELISQPKDSDSRHSQSNSHTAGNGSDSANGGTNGTSGIKRAADIFSLGCLFFWVLTNGEHPYEDDSGWTGLRELNIKRNKKNMAVLERWQDSYEPLQLIEWMLESMPENRPTALQVLNHPFFWTAEKRLAFLCDASDHFEREPRGTVDDGYVGDSFDLSRLEAHAGQVIGEGGKADFLLKLDRVFVDTLGKQRKYSGNRLLDLLRALRNKKNHYEDMPADVKARVGPLAGGYLHYWTDRFPLLLTACYEVVHEIGVSKSDRFKAYFSQGQSM